MKCCLSTEVRTWTNWLTLELNLDHSPDAGTRKSENQWSVDVRGKQAPHSKQATGHVMHCREIVFTPCCTPRIREFRGSVDFSVRHMVAELWGIKVAQFSDFGLFSPYKTSLQPMGYIAEWSRFFHVVVKRELYWRPIGSRTFWILGVQ